MKSEAEFMDHVTREFDASLKALTKQLTAIAEEATANRMLCITTLSKEMNQVMNETVNLAVN
jgi:recombinational DNA repair ATPase RecF